MTKDQIMQAAIELTKEAIRADKDFAVETRAGQSIVDIMYSIKEGLEAMEAGTPRLEAMAALFPQLEWKPAEVNTDTIEQ